MSSKYQALNDASRLAHIDLTGEDLNCPLCGRIMIDGPSVDRHHLVPSSCGGKEAERCHRICHRKIHATFTEHELEKIYNTWDALRAHEEIQKFVKWIAKKPPDFYKKNRDTRRRNGKRWRGKKN